LVVAIPAGSGTDIAARMIAHGLSERLGRQVVVDNRPGAGTIIGNEIVAKAKPDGYTLLVNGCSKFFRSNWPELRLFCRETSQLPDLLLFSKVMPPDIDADHSEPGEASSVVLASLANRGNGGQHWLKRLGAPQGQFAHPDPGAAIAETLLTAFAVGYLR
jgi:hypothetical protein